MARYVLERLLLMIPVLLGVVVILFTIHYVSPGDPLAEILGPNASPEQRALKAAELGIDRPYPVQLAGYLRGVVCLDFGTSFRTGQPVSREILERLPVTLLLTLLTAAVSTLGILFGVITAARQNSAMDYIITFVSLVGASVPSFWLCLMLMLIFSLRLGWLPAVGFSTPVHWILPTAASAFLPLAVITRNTRSAVLEVIRQDYIRTARAKGLSEAKVLTRHALRNALIPVVTVITMQIGISLAGTIVTESIFSIGGVGSLLLAALFSKNYPTIQGCTLWIGFVCCILNLVADLGYAWIDPRIREQFTTHKGYGHRVRSDGLADSLDKRRGWGM